MPIATDPTPITAETWIHTRVLVLNASYEALAEVPADRAIILVISGAATTLTVREPYFPIRSQRVEIALPEAILLARYVHLPDLGIVRDEGRATNAGVLRRDRNRCGYCAKVAHTIDHIRPRSRGGPNTWANLIACCAGCNTTKADRTPEEAGMRLLWEPKAPNPLAKHQRRIWQQLATQT